MLTVSPIFALFIYLIAFSSASLIVKRRKAKDSTTRYEGIDALRGFLALGVFIHHSAVWHQYIHEGKWYKPGSNLFVHFGETSVSFFFMITAFLFISKLLKSTDRDFDWPSLLYSRIFRLFPMYIISIVILFICVMFVTNWQLRVGILDYGLSAFEWGSFGIIRQQDINGSGLTSIINAGVVWSLRLEWLFYFSLPLVALFILKKKPALFYLLIGLVFVVGYTFAHGVSQHHIYSFLGGSIAPFILKYGKQKIKYESAYFSLVIIACLGLILLFSTANSIGCKILIAIVFTLIALGNDIFGVLRSSTLKFLGEICYSTYLLHGIILFVVFYFGFGIENARQLSPFWYCIVILSVTPLIVFISYLGYRFIEHPFIEMAKKIVGLRRNMAKLEQPQDLLMDSNEQI